MARHGISYILKILRVFCGLFSCVKQKNEETEEFGKEEEESEEVREVEKEGEFVQ